MSTAAEQEAERRYLIGQIERVAFVAGAAFERSRHRELLEAAREYNRARKWDGDPWTYATNKRLAMEELVAAAAALDKEGGE